MAETDRQGQLATAIADAIKASGYLDREGGVAHGQALRGLTGALREKLGQY